MEEEILNRIVDMDEQGALALARQYLEKGGDAAKLLAVCRNAMKAIGERFEKGEYFLSELLLGSEIFGQIMGFTLPHLKGESKKIGRIVLGTVRGDIHNIGKDIFKAFAEAAGFEVTDLGVDVPEEKFVEAVRKHKPDIVGMSCLITAGIGSMKKTVEAIRAAGLGGVRIIIGGGRVDGEVQRLTGADAWADDAAKGVRLCRELIGVKE